MASSAAGVLWPHGDDLDGYHIKTQNLNDATGQLALGKDYKNSISGPRGNQSSTSFLHTYRIILGKAHQAHHCQESLAFLSLGKFSLTDFEMKLAIFAFALIGAVLASPIPDDSDGE